MFEFSLGDAFLDPQIQKEGFAHWKSPSNIAIVKYWGKHGRQLPSNPSLSLTLNNAYTEMLLEYQPKGTETDRFTPITLQYLFEGKEEPKFQEKMLKFLEGLDEQFPFLRQYHLHIQSLNTFPHSSGIASSAASMSALALCLCTMEHELFGTLESDLDFEQKASFVARLGSGSASRSVFSRASLWGYHEDVPGSSDYFAIGVEKEIDPIFHTYHDDILLIHKGQKSVSSTAGHALMKENPYAQTRFDQAKSNTTRLLDIMAAGDVEAFGHLAEQEALTLHALMMSSDPSYILMQPNTLQAINKVREFRLETKIPLYFTLDAGPNIHLLYPHAHAEPITDFIITDLVQFCQDQDYLADEVGEGPIQI